MYFRLLKNRGMIMKLPMIAGVIAFAFASEGAMAACSAPAATQVKHNSNPGLSTLLSGNTACAVRGGDRWQEEHHPGGVLKDYKKGASDAVDPTKQVGTWSVGGTGANTMVTYIYGSGGTYAYTVWDNGGSYSFCGTSDMDVTITRGTGVGCPP